MMNHLYAAVVWMVAIGLVGCGGGGGGASPATPAGLASNEQVIYVDAGPPGTGYNANRLYTDVTVCQPGSSVACVVIDHVLVDSGSTGLRLLSSDVTSSIGLSSITVGTSQTLINCARFVDGSFGWGPVATADVKLGGQTASGVRIQLMGDPAFNGSSGLCSSGTAIKTAADIGAKGILGVGLFKEDCGSACAAAALAKYYYACTTGGPCASVAVPLSGQVKNPVPLLATDNNGVLVDLPVVGTQPAANLAGKLIFGIGTRTNNGLGTASVFKTDSQGFITTSLGGKVMTQSFLDTGSNGLYFDNSAATGVTGLTTCFGATAGLSFYCPTSTMNLSATISSTTASAAVSFFVDDAAKSFVGTPPVLPGLAGTFGSAGSFDWGLPFFFGRRVFFGIEGMVTPVGVGPYYAF